jgi:hypothetical protein
MEMSTDLKKMLDSLPEKKRDRGRQSIYVSKAIWDKFKKATSKVGASLALEMLMEQTIAEAEKKK